MLWYVGSVYVIILLLIIIVGLGIVGTKLLNFSAGLAQGLLAGRKFRPGGDGKQNTSWLNYAALAFTGIIISYFALGLSAVNETDSAHNHGGGSSPAAVQTGNSHGAQTAVQGGPADIQMQYPNLPLNSAGYNPGYMGYQYYNNGY